MIGRRRLSRSGRDESVHKYPPDHSWNPLDEMGQAIHLVRAMTDSAVGFRGFLFISIPFPNAA